jgi:hypothetical protein
MIVFNPHWGTTRRVQIEAPSHPLQGVEIAKEPQGKPFAIVHGYDRDWDVKSLFEFKYRAGVENFSLEEFKKWNEEVARHIPAPRRGLRRLVRESVASFSQLPYPGRVFKRHT